MSLLVVPDMRRLLLVPRAPSLALDAIVVSCIDLIRCLVARPVYGMTLILGDLALHSRGIREVARERTLTTGNVRTQKEQWGYPRACSWFQKGPMLRLFHMCGDVVADMTWSEDKLVLIPRHAVETAMPCP